MKSKLIALFLVIILVVGGFFLWQMMDEEETPVTQDTSSQPSSESDETPVDQAEDVVDQANAQAVEIDNFAFSPANLTVKKGTTVTWTNKESIVHTVTSDDAEGPLNSGDIGRNETFSFTFSEVGNFAYHCQPHPQMTGTITVVE